MEILASDRLADPFSKSVNKFLRAVEVLGALGVSGVLNVSIFTFLRNKTKHHIYAVC